MFRSKQLKPQEESLFELEAELTAARGKASGAGLNIQ
jgi:hypothetical protein